MTRRNQERVEIGIKFARFPKPDSTGSNPAMTIKESGHPYFGMELGQFPKPDSRGSSPRTTREKQNGAEIGIKFAYLALPDSIATRHACDGKRYGIQTSPAMARVTASLIAGRGRPGDLIDLDVSEAALSPARFRASRS